MITYSLICKEAQCGNQYTSDFKDIAAYDKLYAAGMLQCPSCGSNHVDKALMAPSVNKTSGIGTSREGDYKQFLRQVRSHLETHGESVGDKFADEARKIHSGDKPDRLIYGTASQEELQELKKDGVPVSSIPWVSPNDA